MAEVSLLEFERELEVEIQSIGIGKKRVAALGQEPWWKDRGEWHRVPIAATYRPKPDERDETRIFFGRDDRPRLMGTRHRGDAPDTFVYLRLMPAGWRPALYEIGKLGSRALAGGMFGVLGHDDPEVVCRVSEECIIKRQSGWKNVDSGPGRPLVKLCGAEAWALYPQALAHMTDSGWQRLGHPVPWREASGFWAVSKHDIWVSEADAQALYHYDGREWTHHRSVIEGPRELWAAAANDVWLVGAGGAGHFDGTAWSRVRGVPGPLSQIEGASAGDLWLGGESGLWHGAAGKDSPQ